MKKITWILLVIILLALTQNVFAADKTTSKETPLVKIVVDGVQTSLNNTPITRNGCVYAEIKDFFRGFNVGSSYIKNNSDSTITVKKDGKELNFKLWSKTAVLDGEEVELEAEVILYKNKTYVPVKSLAKSLSKLVIWNSSINTMVIYDKEMLEKLNTIPDPDEKYDDMNYHKIQTEIYKENGKQIFHSKSDIKGNPLKGIEYVANSTTVGTEKTKKTEYFENEKYYYSRASTRKDWYRETKKKVETKNTSKTDKDLEDQKTASAAMVVKEKTNSKIVVEGDLVLFGKNIASQFGIDLLKDKKAKSHMTIEFDAVSGRIKRTEIKITGRIENGKSNVPYELTTITDFDLNEKVTVTTPKDLKNYYTVAKGYKEYYNSKKSFSVIVQESWILPGSADEEPLLLYLDKKNDNKWSAVIIYQQYMTGNWTLPLIRDGFTENVKSTLKNSKLLKREYVKWDKYNGLRITVSGINKKTGKQEKVEVTAVNYKGTLLIFSYMGDPTTYSAKYNEAAKIIKSWKKVESK